MKSSRIGVVLRVGAYSRDQRQDLSGNLDLNPIGKARSYSAAHPQHLCGRCILLLMTAIAAGGCPVVENPGSSLIYLHDRFQWMIDRLRAIGISVSSAAAGAGCVREAGVPNLISSR